MKQEENSKKHIDIKKKSFIISNQGGEIIVKSKRNQTTLRLPLELDEKLILLSKKYGVSKNAYILMVLSKEVMSKENIA